MSTKQMRLPARQYVGLTMIELLVVVAILGLLTVMSLVGYRSYLDRAHDGQRKTDIKKIAAALDEYYNDHSGYPVSLAVGAGSTCGIDTILTPYLKEVPCDPAGTTTNYLYIPQGTPHAVTGSRGIETVHRGYRLLTALSYDADPQVAEVGCAGGAGCGGTLIDGTTSVPAAYNFGLAANAKVNMSE